MWGEEVEAGAEFRVAAVAWAAALGLSRSKAAKRAPREMGSGCK